LPVVIVSGLAYGIDSIAHRAALDNGILTVAVPGSGLSDDVLYPAAHIGLAREILEKDGALVSPFDRDMAGTTWMFPHRNRIMAGMSHATLVIEANIKSGTLITSKHATEFNRNVCAVPGSIFSSVSEGPHMLIRLGATPIRHAGDLIEALGLDPQTPKATFDIADLSEDERRVVLALETPLSRDDLVEKLGMPVHEVSTLVSLLEIKGVIEELLGELRRI
jgi:DNA processing protein